MTQNTNLNVSPYYDDFNENKNYNKVLFKPGFPIQSRELTTLQSILQNQIERFGQYFFKEGSMVIPGGTFLDTSYFSVRIDPTFLNIPVKSYTKYLADNEITIQGETSGVTATVINRLTDIESEEGYDTLYIKYKKSASDGIGKSFVDGENLITLSDIEYSNTRITANSLFARCIVSEATKTGSSASVSEGVFFVRGYFVKVPSSTIILDQYSSEPSYRIGLSVNEEIVNASSVNRDLYDNAKGYSNESAPGADRFKISTTLVKKSLTDTDDLTFVELMRVENGQREEFVNKTDFNIFKDELARRTYDESGDYYVKPFKVELKETLNDRISNRGLYFENQITKNGNTPVDDFYTIQVSPGKAYVRGNEVDKQSTTALDIVKPRTTRKKENVSIPVGIGNVARVENAFGSPSIGFSADAVDLFDRRLVGNNAKDGNAVAIGKARVYDYQEKSVAGAATTQYEARFYDVSLFTKITVGTALTTTASSYVKGKYSGSSGYLTAAVSNSTNLTLSCVRGEFQLNEPLEINGLDVGRNVTNIDDFTFADVKSVHKVTGSNTFAADIVLDRDTQSFSERSNFTITNGGAVTSPSIANFKSLVKVGDIVRYSKPGGTLPTFNRVSAGVNSGTLTLVAVTSVAGVCDGTLPSGTITTNDFDVIAGTLKNAADPGYRIKLQNSYVSSINLLDSTYIVRKQISKNITGSTFTFLLSDLGDNDLTFEPFTADTYVLTWQDGVKELIRSSQVTFSTNLKEVTFTSLSKTGNATLTFTAKRSKLLSKDKSISRCRNIIINKSKNAGAGIGATTFNNGLSGPNTNGGNQYAYGTRVEDEEICLNFPDIHRVLGVFASSGTGDPALPSLDASNQTATFSNNVVVGERFIGSTSGAVARVVDVVSGTQINFVYENTRAFEVDESFTLKSSGIVATIGSLVAGDANIFSNYDLDKGHRPEFVDYGRIIRKAGAEEPNSKLRIIFDHFVTNESTGTVESVNSYNSLDYGYEVPTVSGVRSSDFIDIRPRVAEYTTSNTSPFDYTGRSFAGTSSETVVSDKTITLDYSYYLGRVDRLYLSKDGTFNLKKGTPSELPKPPIENNEGMLVAVIAMTPYVFNATFDSNVKLIPHRRYTMKDIGGLEKRISNLEEYTTLSLLETDTKNLSIKDPNTGLDKFKSGFFVDNFRSHKNHNLTGDSFFDMDRVRGECRPRSTERNVSLGFETVSTQADPINADYAWVDDFSDTNVTRGGTGLTLNYEEVEFVDQPLATRVENLNPFHIVLYTGTVSVTPESDFWIEENILPTTSTTNIDSSFNAIADLLGIEDRENGGMAATMWNSSEINWTGQETLISSELVNEESTVTRNWTTRRGRRTDWWQERTITRDFDQVFEEQGLETITGLELTSNQQLQSIGNTVVSTEAIFTVRSRNLELVATNLKPNTRYYAFMENVDMNEFTFPKRLPITMISGSFTPGEIVQTSQIPNGMVARSLPQTQGRPQITARVANSNHRSGPFNNPIETYDDLPATYSNTSTFLNIDTADLALLTMPDRRGFVRAGDELSSGNAIARVENIELVTDDKGTLSCCLHIPDPLDRSNPQFTTGANNIRLTTSPTNERDLDPGESAVDVTFFSSGIQQNLEEQVLSIRQPQIQSQVIVDNQPVTRLNERTLEGVEEVVDERIRTRWSDPLAQSFLVPKENGVDGIFITGGELYFKTKDPEVPITVQVRTMRDGAPTETVIPFGEVQILPEDVNLSDDGSAATRFKFKTPVYLQGGFEYCFALLATTAKYLTFITRMGEVDLLLNSVYNRQPYLGSLFKSQNSTTWDASQLEDLKFKLFKAKFVTNTPSTVIFYNHELPMGELRKANPVTAYSKRQLVSIASTTNLSFDQGTTITQSSGVSGKVFATGGPVEDGTSGLSLTGAGIGLTPTSGNFTYTGIGFTSLTGYGSSVTASINISAGAVNTITVTDGGNGYQVGDLLLSNNIGNTGSGVRVTVGVVTETNLLVVDDVQGNFIVGAATTHTDGGGTGATLTNPTAVSSDPIRDGHTLLIDHVNHGMHSSSNVVKLEDIVGDIEPTSLTTKIDENSSVIIVEDGSQFTSFEGTTVSGINTGYVKINKEIFGYTAVNGNELQQITRAVDSSLKSNHAAKSFVNKYEFNGVSLLKINKEHNLDNREKTFNSYHIPLSDTSKSFNSTKVGGGSKVRASQNVPFEYINPKLNVITPSGTTLSARIKTTSGTSLSGNEASFQDQGYENIALNKLNVLDSQRIVASKTNEYNLLGNDKSFALELTMSTLNENVSPIVDLETANIILTSNLVNEKVNDYVTDRRARLSGFDPNAGIYETQKINLEFPSNSILVQFDGHRDEEADLRVFYKLFREGTSDGDQVYIPFNTNGSSDKQINPNVGYNEFSEYKFTTNNTPLFNGFMIKVVMTSTNQAKAPRFKNFRAIALRSFENE